MKTLILEPGYFPELKYIAACLYVDRIILADNVRFRKKAHFNRSKIRNPLGTQWLTIPLAPKQKQLAIGKVKVASASEWSHIHERCLGYNYRSSPYFEHYEPGLQSFYSSERRLLLAWTLDSIELVLSFMKVDREIVIASDLYQDLGGMLDLIGKFGQDERIFVSSKEWWRDSLPSETAEVYNWEHPSYNQNFEGFFEELSVLDLIFNYGPDAAGILKSGIVPKEN